MCPRHRLAALHAVRAVPPPPPRLLPFKNVEYTTGAAEALAFFLRLSPPLLRWGPDLEALANDGLELAKVDEAVLAAQLPASRWGGVGHGWLVGDVNDGDVQRQGCAAAVGLRAGAVVRIQH